MDTAIFAAGCFWGVEAAFRRVEGVVRTTAGYTGGATEAPTYEQVCSGRTGHAEAVEVAFDPAVVSFEELLDVFWASHDPGQRNRQGPDVGTQYRSAVFVRDDGQRRAAEESKRRLVESGRTVVTEITSAATFWPAEDYHQQYLAQRGQDACASTIRT